MPDLGKPYTVLIASYLEPEHVERLRQVDGRLQIIYGGNNETLFFLKRCGGYHVTVDLEQEVAFWHSEEFVKGLKDFGFNIVLASFEKNHVIEEEFVEARKALVKLVHKYGMRLAVSEPPFSHITSSLKLDRFTLRGKKKINTQWNLFCIVHNLAKIHRYGPGYA